MLISSNRVYIRNLYLVNKLYREVWFKIEKNLS